MRPEEYLCIGGPLAGKRVAVNSPRLLVPVIPTPTTHVKTGPDDPAGYYDEGGEWRWGPPLKVATHLYEIEYVLMYRGEET